MHVVLASLFESTTDLFIDDPLCMKYLAIISDLPQITHKEVQSHATSLANLILVLKKRAPEAANLRAALDFDHIKILVTAIRVVATDKVTMKLDMDQVLQLSTIMGELIAIAQDMSVDEKDVEYLEELKKLLESEKWVKALTKPVK